jgi:hypothetical protein
MSWGLMGPSEDPVPGAHLIALVHAHVLPDRHLVGPLGGSLVPGHDHLALPALDLAKADEPIDLGDDRRILRATGLEELRNPGETPGDVAGLEDLAADLGERVTRGHLRTVLHGQLSAHRHNELAQLLAHPCPGQRAGSSGGASCSGPR